MPIASGGMGSVEVVLRAEGRFERLYACKRPHPHLLSGPEGEVKRFLSRFLDEARLAGLVRHPNAVSVLDVGTDERGPFLLLDLVDGLSVAEIVRAYRTRGDALPVEVCLDIVAQAADGLHAAHELRDHEGRPVGLVHRDVSPQNVLVGFDGVVRVTDFGLAKALEEETESTADVLKGKLGYMSPEQLRFEQIDRRSDLFALGVVLYEMLSGERLYGGEARIHAAQKILSEAPPDISEVRDDVPAALVELLFDLLAKDRAQRPSDADSVARRARVIRRELDDAIAEAGEEPLDFGAFLRDALEPERVALVQRRAAAVGEARARVVTLDRRSRRSRAIAWTAMVAAIGAVAYFAASGPFRARKIADGQVSSFPVAEAPAENGSPPRDNPKTVPRELPGPFVDGAEEAIGTSVRAARGIASPSESLDGPAPGDRERPSTDDRVPGSGAPTHPPRPAEVAPEESKAWSPRHRAKPAARAERGAAPPSSKNRPEDRLWGWP